STQPGKPRSTQGLLADSGQRQQQNLDFDRNDVWRVLVGGAKLSRGFTVEGLTISFYTRKALQGDTLMQAGRWFGFRQGYRDLVRLFIRRDPDDAPKRVDLYEAFDGLMRDEVALRTRLQDYEGFQDDGTPILEPWQVPPIVSQHLPYLKPTGRTKMFNAVINTLGEAGRLKDYYGLPPRKDATGKAANFVLMTSLLQNASEKTTFTSSRRRPEDPASSFEALVGIISAKEFLNALSQLKWHPDYADKVIAPTLRFYEKLVSNGKLQDVALVWPQLTRFAERRELPGYGQGQVITRNRREWPRIDFVGSDSKHRDAVERIAGTTKTSVDDAADALRDPHGTRGALLLYVASDPADGGDRRCPAADVPDRPDASDLAVLISMVAPATATPNGGPVVEWTVRRSSQRGVAVVDAP
ncbi:Z1 domain-containing protein, partial [Pseudonocardia sp. RS11V-5]|uniref:Z1 domain-containing protein n=1 Tax=Pseudonocardia terrae TaxID=2905831 RepID=UPI001E625F36